MAISPPSDLVLDVVRAADPQAVQAAQQKLSANRAAFAATSLAEAGQGFGAAVDATRRAERFVAAEGTRTAAQSAGLGNVTAHMKSSDIPKPYKDFEAVFLQNFVKTMLPQDSEEIYGKGSAGEIWKSMQAEQFANARAAGDGVGVAQQLYAQALQRAEGRGEIHASTDENDRKVAIGMITDFERRTLGVSGTEEKNEGKA